MAKKNLYIADILSNNNYGKCTGHFIPVATNYMAIFHKYAEVKVAAGPIYGNSFRDEYMLWLPYNVSSKAGTWNTIKGKYHSLSNCLHLIRKAKKNSTIIWQQSTVITSCVGLLMFCHRQDLNIYMIQYSKSALDSRLKKFLYNLCRHKLKGVICPNDEVGQAYGLPYCVVPDYIYTGGFDSITPIPYAKRMYDVCIMGRFNKDKGVVETINKLRNSAYKVIVAGRPDNEAYGREIESAAKDSSNIELHLGFIDTDDYNNYIRNSRYCILNYQGEYSVRSSGVVYDIIFNGVPVIGTHCSALQFVEDFKVGYLYDSLACLDINSLLDERLYADYQFHIDKYRKHHKTYINKIKNFIGL